MKTKLPFHATALAALARAGLVPALLLISLTASTQALAQSSVVAHYRFESGPDAGAVSTITDSGPNLLHGTASGTLFYLGNSGTHAAMGTFSLDAVGDADFGQVADSPLLHQQGDWTVELFFKADSPYDEFGSPDFSTLAVKLNTTASGGFLGGFEINSAHNGQVGCTVSFGGGTGAGVATSGLNTRDGHWHHLAAIMDRDVSGTTDQLSLYVDGVLQASIQGVWPDLFYGDQPLYIGAGNFNGTTSSFRRNFDGQIDELRISSAALTPPEFLAPALAFSEFVDPHPAPGNEFGHTVMPLSTGNVVITAPYDDAGGVDAGAVYLFNGATGALISTLRGSHSYDRIGGYQLAPGEGVVALPSGHFVVPSENWNDGRGAVTWGNGVTGVSGTVSAANSLVGTASGDRAGSGGVTVLANGNYVVRSSEASNGPAAYAGAVTWGSGLTGVSGLVSAANSLVGTSEFDGIGGVTEAPQNSGNSGVFALPNGHYVVASPRWNNGVFSRAGAVTFCNGNTGTTGPVTTTNSLTGSGQDDYVGLGDNSAYSTHKPVTVLTNGNYVVVSPRWSSGGGGAATWASGTTGISGPVSAANSLVGTPATGNVGDSGVVALKNGHYVVCSPHYKHVTLQDAGAVTWGDGTTGITGPVTPANSLTGNHADDSVGLAVTALSDGNFVVCSPRWHKLGVPNVGAVTWCDGSGPVVGVVSATGSLTGAIENSFVGTLGAVPLSDGRYVVRSMYWRSSPTVAEVGAVTWRAGGGPETAVVSAANSLVGTEAFGHVGLGTVVELSNGNYVVCSPEWGQPSPGSNAKGAVTWCSKDTPTVGEISAANSLVGLNFGDHVGSGNEANVGHGGVVPLDDGNYVVVSPLWGEDSSSDHGAVTWCNGTTGRVGTVTTANSYTGKTSTEQLGRAGRDDPGYELLYDYDYIAHGGVLALHDGAYVINSPYRNNGATQTTAGAVMRGVSPGLVGQTLPFGSLVGAAAGTDLRATVLDAYNDTFYGRFTSEGTGRVRVASQSGAPPPPPEIVVEKPLGTALTSGGTLDLAPVFAGESADVQITVRNVGSSTLIVTDTTLLTGGGAPSPDFTVLDYPRPGIDPGTSSLLTVRFAPSALGLKTAVLRIYSSDPDTPVFTLTLRALAKVVRVTGNGQPIANNDSTPSLNDLTDFGQTAPDSGSVTQSFTIQNTGASVLTLGTVSITGAHAGDFTVTTAPSTTLASGASTTLDITFDPTALGVRTAQVSFTTSSPDETPFTFAISGTGNTPPVFNDMTINTVQGKVTAINEAKILLRVTDPDGQPLSIVGVWGSSFEGASISRSGGFISYSPPPGFVGTDGFYVTVSDGFTTVDGLILINVAADPGLNPNNPPQLTPIAGGAMRLGFNGIPGRVYGIQRSTDLSTWTQIATPTASSTGAVTIDDPSPPEGSAFYRIIFPAQ